MHRMFRASTAAPLVAILLVTSLSGCHWFKKKNELYTQTAEARPLEVPPDLNLPNTSGAMQVPNVGPAASSAGAATNAAGGFTVGGSRDEAFTRVGEALAGIEGVAIASRAQLLGSFDVSYGGVDFLIRTLQSGERVSVSAVDPRGLPATGEAATAVMAQLKAGLEG